MRLVHKSLVPILTKKATQELIWSVSLIADEIVYLDRVDDSELHLETLKVLSYPISHFVSYCRLVIARAIELGIDFSLDIDTIAIMNDGTSIKPADIFSPWMDNRYFIDDYWHLKEFYYDSKMMLDCERIWYKIC